MSIIVPNNNIYIDILDSLDYHGFSNRWEVSSDKIIIYGENSYTLNEYIHHYGNLTYDMIIKLILNIGTQLAILGNNNKGIPYFSGDEITVINNNFIITDLSKISILNNNKIKINNNINYNKFYIAPEILNNSMILFYTHTSCIYYSFGKLCIYALGNKNIEKIKNTKLEAFLKRCLHNIPENRNFLYI